MRDIDSPRGISADERCPSCDHHWEHHTTDGCGFRVGTVAAGAHRVCGCALPLAARPITAEAR